VKPLVLGVAAVALLLGGMFVGRQLVPQPNFDAAPETPAPSPSPGASPTPTTSPAPVPDGFVLFEDEEAGFSVAYPGSWERLESSDPQVRLVATPNGRDSLLVRVLQPGFAVTEDNLRQAKTLTDSLVRAGRNVKILAKPEPIRLGGLPGLFYFYSFRDSGTGKRGVHSHYFLFRGETMITIVFQALPTKSFPELAPIFDQVANSFRAGSQ
jgi:eukaryotic-like serine/threonine-protein kinase